MANNRIFWACQAVTKDGNFLTGVQAVGVNGNTPVTTLTDIGRPESNFKFETKDKEFEVTISRVIDKSGSLFHTWTGKPIKPGNIGWGGSGNNDIQSFDITILYGSDQVSNIGDASLASTTYHKCIITSLSYNFTVGGLITEDITLTSRRTTTSSSGSAGIPSAGSEQSGNIIKRQDVSFSLPTMASNILGSDPLTVDGQSVYGVQSINLSMDISYSRLNDTGKWRGYDNVNEVNKFTFVDTPISVACNIAGIARSKVPGTTLGEGNQEITGSFDTITVSAGSFTWNLGDKNYLQDYSVSGGNTDGGNAEVSFTYVNENNDFSVS
jgi:hypothetical protein